MLFKDNFYTLVERVSNDDDTLFKIKLNPEHTIFDGHFPDNPVTPGVVQMEIIKELTSIEKEANIEMLSMSNCKFLAILNPQETSEVNVLLKIGETDSNNLKVSALISNEETKFLKMSAEYSIK